MDSPIADALTRGGLIDITTTGRQTGLQRRLEIAYHVIDRRIFITGRPSHRKRGWIANLEADPHLTFHLKRGVRADLPATGRVITEDAERREILTVIARSWNTSPEPMVAYSPLIEVTIDPAALGAAA
jgi:hypothetical protein